MKNRDITMLCTRLLVLSTIWQMVELSSVNTTDSEDVQVAEACSLNITDFDEVQELFKEYTTERNVQLVDFRISGIEWSDSSNESIEVFDPNMLSWAAKKSEVLTQMPMDFSILSFGLSKLAMMDLEVSVVSFPTGCVQGLPFQHQRRLVMKEVLHLTNIGEDDEEENLICQHDYSRRIAGRVIGVGRSCCNRRDLRSGRVYTECKRDKKTLRMIKRFVQSFEAISVFGFLLPFFIIPCAVVWWQYNPLSFSDIFTEYMSNKLYKMSIFKLASRQQAVLGQSRANGTFHERKMVIGDDELELYETPVTIFTLLDINMRGVSCGKIKLTLLFIFQYVPVVAWLVQYSRMNNTLQLLDSAGKIVLNLHNNPYSWLWTDRSFSPFYIALMLIFLNFLLVVFVILWWLMEFKTVRLHFAKLLQLKADEISSRHKSKETVRMVFKLFFVSLVVLSYIFVYSMFNCVIYATGALIASINIVAPWLTCAVLVIYYTKRSCSELTETYTEIKRLAFKVCDKMKTYKATQIERVEVVKVIAAENTLDLKNKTYKYKSEEFDGTVWFVTPKKKPDPRDGETHDVGRSSFYIPVPSATGPAESLLSHPEKIEQQSNTGSHESTDSQDWVNGALAPEYPQPPEVIGHQADASSNEGVGHNPDEKQGTGLLEVRMSKAILRGIYELVEPIKEGFKKTVVKLLFIVLFLALVGITMGAFRPDAVTVGAGVMTSLSTLCLALIPRILELIAKSTDAERRLKADNSVYTIRKLLYANTPIFKVIENASSHSHLPTPLLQETEQRNEIERSHRQDTLTADFGQVCSEHPTGPDYSQNIVPKLIVINENAPPNPPRPTRLPQVSGQKDEMEMKDITPH